MLKVFLLTLVIVLVAVVLFCVKVIFLKNGRFPNTHVGSSKTMRNRGIYCVQTQDRMARMKKKDDEKKDEEKVDSEQNLGNILDNKTELNEKH